MNELQESKILRGLNQTAIFKSIPDEALIRLSKKAGIEQYKPEEIIVSEGDDSDRLFIIINGIVTLKKVLQTEYQYGR